MRTLASDDVIPMLVTQRERIDHPAFCLQVPHDSPDDVILIEKGPRVPGIDLVMSRLDEERIEDF